MLKVFIVYHKIFNEGRTLKYEADYNKETFVLYGVNEIFTKDVTPTIPHIREYELNNYNPFLQLRSYMETTAYYHIYRNKMYEGLDFVGVCQYDMIFNNKIEGLQKDTIYCMKSSNPIATPHGWTHLMFPNNFAIDDLLQSYNRHFGTSYTRQNMSYLPLSLFQTNIYDVEIFKKLGSWLEVLVDDIYPSAVREPHPTQWGAMGGYTERALSIFNAIQFLEGKKCQNLSLEHVEMCDKGQYNPRYFLNYYCSDVYTKFISRTEGKQCTCTLYLGESVYTCIQNGSNNMRILTPESINLRSGCDARLISRGDRVYITFLQDGNLTITDIDRWHPIILRMPNGQPCKSQLPSLLKDDKMYFISSYNPFTLQTYDFNEDGVCTGVSAGTNHCNDSNFVPYKDELFIGICKGVNATHLILLDTSRYSVRYLSRPLIYLGNHPLDRVAKTNIISNIAHAQEPTSLYWRKDKLYLDIAIAESTLTYELTLDIDKCLLPSIQDFYETLKTYGTDLASALEPLGTQKGEP